MRRIYELNGVEISSSRCDGFLFAARKNLGDCIACGEPVTKGQKHIRPNIFSFNEPFHAECYLADQQYYDTPTILGIKIEKRRIFGIVRTYVICKEFFAIEKT